jgi:glutamate-1-semialdehyde aminotransferase
MVDRGVFVAHRGELCCSTPMTDTEVDAAVAAFRDLVEDLEAMA